MSEQQDWQQDEARQPEAQELTPEAAEAARGGRTGRPMEPYLEFGLTNTLVSGWS